MWLSAAFNSLARAVGGEQRIPFALTTEVPNEETRRAIEDAENNVDCYGPFATVEELMEALNA